MTSRLFKRSLVWIFAAVALCCVSASAQDTTPPELEKGWNLVASPCNVKLDQLKKTLNSNGFAVYEWNGTDYVQTDHMVRGYGYALNANSVLNTSTACKQDTATETVTVTLREGWNLIGNPFHHSVTFQEVFGASISAIAIIFEHQGNKFNELTASDKMQVWGGYWVYSNQAISVTMIDPATPPPTVPVTKYLVISVDRTSLTVGQTATFHATLITDIVNNTCDHTLSSVQCPYPITEDVTSKVKWQLSNAVTGSFNSNIFSAAATGVVSVKASILIAPVIDETQVSSVVTPQTLISNTIVLKVEASTPPPPLKKILTIKADKKDLKIGETATFSAYLAVENPNVDCVPCPECDCATNAVDVTAQVKWHQSNAGAGAFTDNVFTAATVGQTDVTATLDVPASATDTTNTAVKTLESNLLNLIIHENTPPPAKKRLFISTDTPKLNVGDTATFKAMLITEPDVVCACVDCGCDQTGDATEPVDVTAQVKWQQSNPNAGAFSANVFAAASQGVTIVTATLELPTSATDTTDVAPVLTSNPVELHIGENTPPAIKRLVISTETPALNVGDTATFKALLITEPDAVCMCVDCDCPQPGAPTKSDDVTSKVKWQQTNPDAGAMKENIFTAAKNGETVVTATLEIDTPSMDPSTKPTADVLVSNPVELHIGDATGPADMKLVISTDRTKIKVNETAAFSVLLLSATGYPVDTLLPLDPEWIVSNPDVGRMEGNTFVAMGTGEASVVATLNNKTLVSNKVVMHVVPIDPVLKSITLKTSRRSMEPNEVAQLQATGFFNDGSHKDITQQVTWMLNPDGAGSIDTFGAYRPNGIGEIQIRASLGGAVSNYVYISVLHKQLIWLGLAAQPNIVALPQPGNIPDSWSNPQSLRIYYNDYYMYKSSTGSFRVMASYNSDEFRMFNPSEVSWDIKDTSVISVSADGTLTGLKEGLTGVRAYREGVYTEWAWVRVVISDTQKFLLLDYSNSEVVVPVGGTRLFDALYVERTDSPVESTPSAFSVDGMSDFKTTIVTNTASWIASVPAVGSVSKGKFLASGVGRTPLWAEYDGLKSQVIDIEAWQKSEIAACDPDAPNASEWGDGVSKAILETSCKTYNRGTTVPIRFSAGIDQSLPTRALDACLDLYIYDTNKNLVRTIRDFKCSPEELFKTMPGFRPVYDYSVEWDQRDGTGSPVPAGDYIAVARFYLLYCPVLKVNFKVQ